MFSSTFFKNDVNWLGFNTKHYQIAYARLDKQKYIYLKDNIVFGVVCDNFFKKVASRRIKETLMRAWLTGIVLAIFGLWLATI